MRGKTSAPINPMILGLPDRVLCTGLIPSGTGRIVAVVSLW